MREGERGGGLVGAYEWDERLFFYASILLLGY